MNTIPWYRSKILQGILTSIVAQVLARSKLSSIITSDQAVQIIDFALDSISGAALAYAAHARVTKPIPPVSISKASADATNASNAPSGPTGPTG